MCVTETLDKISDFDIFRWRGLSAWSELDTSTFLEIGDAGKFGIVLEFPMRRYDMHDLNA